MIRHGDKEVDLDRGYRAGNAVEDSVVLPLECRQPESPLQGAQLIPHVKLAGKGAEPARNLPVPAPGRGRVLREGSFPGLRATMSSR
jgi:hypothetical protein